MEKGDSIGKYSVCNQIPSSTGEVFRVKNTDGINCFLKLFKTDSFKKGQIFDNGEILEINLAKTLHHPNLCQFIDSGSIIRNGRREEYIVYNYISGETIAQKLSREKQFRINEAKNILSGVLNGVKFLHNCSRPIIHNDLTLQNIMLDLSKNVVIPKIVDLGHARYLDQGRRVFDKEGLNPFYMAPELFNGFYSVQTDLYSIGAMLYHLLFGLPPFFIDLSRYKDDREAREDALIAEKNKQLKIPSTGSNERLSELIPILQKALSYNSGDRFKNADEFIRALDGEIQIMPEKQENVSFGRHKSDKGKSQKGFADIAGMKELKEQLQSDVIDLLNNPNRANELGLSIPNGLLFYGPPGCGKTYFAEKFAEEIGCNYKYIKCSDVASPYIHGGQEKIAAIFDDARKNAPTVLFFDEIEAMIKDRSKQTSVSEAGEVNEFLTQLNNCGQDGVIVIGATNKPTEIDEAAVRAGRLEYKYYIPQPDFETRRELFIINLSKRKKDFGIDYNKLAEETENYVAADIKLIVDSAARLVFRNNKDCITMASLEEAINNTKPSVSIDMIHKHEEIRDIFEGKKPEEQKRARIGFK